MPELPEVQTIIDCLKEDGILNCKITNIDIINPKIIKNKNINEFKDIMINNQFTDIHRIGKYLIFSLDNEYILSVHLRMEGKLFFDHKDDLYDENHVLIRFMMGDRELRYHDTRRFGTFNIYLKNEYLNSPELKKLALDPLDEKFNSQYLFEKIKNKKCVIKTALLNQENVSGIGNIYADEILFYSKIHPLTKCNLLNLNDYERITKNAKIVLETAIKNKGTTVSSYLFKKNHVGNFQKMLKVHMRKNQPCYECNNIIKKIKVNGRGTYFCPQCQNENMHNGN